MSGKYADIKRRVYLANIALPKAGLVTLTWGNVSEIDREAGIVAIKPSGVSYEEMTEDDIVIIDLDGNKVEGELNPSSDTPTHLELYRRYPSIGGITHTHSRYATSFAQAEMKIPCFGTTHADVFYGDVPCTRRMTDEEIFSEYEKNTGTVIAETIGERAEVMPAVIVALHGPFTWGKSAMASVEGAITLEECAVMAYNTLTLNKGASMQDALLEKHYKRKHGKGAYYGQGGRK